jgi:hypothetical protein
MARAMAEKVADFMVSFLSRSGWGETNGADGAPKRGFEAVAVFFAVFRRWRNCFRCDGMDFKISLSEEKPPEHG